MNNELTYVSVESRWQRNHWTSYVGPTQYCRSPPPSLLTSCLPADCTLTADTFRPCVIREDTFKDIIDSRTGVVAAAVLLLPLATTRLLPRSPAPISKTQRSQLAAELARWRCQQFKDRSPEGPSRSRLPQAIPPCLPLRHRKCRTPSS